MMKKNSRKQQGATRIVGKKPVKLALRERLPQKRALALPIKLLSGVAVLAIMATLVVGGGRVLERLDPPIMQVTVTGNLLNLDSAAIVSWVEGQITGGVLRTDLRRLQVQLQERPWVASVAVRRQWPDVLHISVQERVAVARWNDEYLLTAQGEVFKPQQSPVAVTLPRLSGEDANASEVLQQFGWMQTQFSTMGLAVVAVSKAQRGAWQAEVEAVAIDDSAVPAAIQVTFGKQVLAERLGRFSTLFESVLQARINEIKRVDLRYTNGIAVQWKKVGKVT
jgi:cell division protein FtsQ